MKDKVIIITGAAMGLGLAAAKELASKGAKLALVDYNEVSLQNAKQELGKENGYVNGQTIAIDGGESNISGNA